MVLSLRLAGRLLQLGRLIAHVEFARTCRSPARVRQVVGIVAGAHHRFMPLTPMVEKVVSQRPKVALR